MTGQDGNITLGSLFDWIGVFPLAAALCGIRPDMAQLGDITALQRDKIPPVHIITFGSPC